MNLPAGAAAVFSEYSSSGVRLALQVQLEPVLVERQRAIVVADGAEAVDVAVADAAPVDELDAELERAAHGAHELHLVDLQRVVEGAQMRHGRFAHADRADVLGFHQPDRTPGNSQRARQRGRGHPAGGAAAHDDDVAESRVVSRADCGKDRRANSIGAPLRAIAVSADEAVQNLMPNDARSVRGRPVMLPSGL